VQGQCRTDIYEYVSVLHLTEQYLNHEITIFRHVEAAKIPAGIYNYDVTFDIPHELPRSDDCITSKISYTMYAHLDIPWSVFNRSSQNIEIERIDNINSYPILLEPRMRSNIKQFGSSALVCFGASDKLIMNVYLPHSGVIPGEVLNVKIRYENRSNVNIKYTNIRLKRTHTEESIEKNRKSQHTFNVTKKRFEGVGKGETKEIICAFEIQRDVSQTDFLFSTASTLRHSLTITAVASGFHFNPTVFFPIVIGTIAATRNMDELKGIPTYNYPKLVRSSEHKKIVIHFFKLFLFSARTFDDE
jgi:hypothetical protein